MVRDQTTRVGGRTACYVYGVQSAFISMNLQKIRPISEASPVRSLRTGRLQALISDVSREEFNDTELQQRDLRWLAEKAQDHNEVARSAATAAAFVPFRFCTVLKDEESVLELLVSQEEILLSMLTKLDGKSEWGVRMARSANVQDAARTHAVKQENESGKEYLLRKQRQFHAERSNENALLHRAEECHRELERFASEAVRLPVNSYSGNITIPNIFNAAYLVADVRAEAFRQQVSGLMEKYSPVGMTLHLTGPWPAYSFANLELGPTGISKQ